MGMNSKKERYSINRKYEGTLGSNHIWEGTRQELYIQKNIWEQSLGRKCDDDALANGPMKKL